MCGLYYGVFYITAVSYLPWSGFLPPFLNQDSVQHGQLKNTHRMTSDSWMSTISIILYLSVTFLDDWLIGQLDDWSHDFVLWYTTCDSMLCQ